MEEKVKDKQQEYVNCNLCGLNSNKLFLQLPDRISGEKFNIVKCSNCGLLFLNPRPTQKTVGNYYPLSYYYKPGSDREARLKKKLSKRINDRIKATIREQYYNYPSTSLRKNKLSEMLKAILVLPFLLRLRLLGRDIKIIPYLGEGRFLEIGCGNGRFLSGQRKLGWKVYGVDKSPHAAGIARKDFGLDVFCGELEDAKYEDSFFDIIYMEHAFEHVPNPSGLLREVHRILKKDGFLIVKVPNVSTFQRFIFRGYWFIWEVPRHFYFYGPGILKKFAAKSGFKIVNIKHDFGEGALRGTLRLFFKRKYNIELRESKFRKSILRIFAYLLGCLHSSDTITVYFKKLN